MMGTKPVKNYPEILIKKRKECINDYFSEDFLLFIKKIKITCNICCKNGNSTCIFARSIGSKLQTGFWLYGVPGSEKSFMQQLIGRFNVVNLPQTISEFTIETLKDASVINIPDIIDLSKDQIQLLRSIIGRDADVG